MNLAQRLTMLRRAKGTCLKELAIYLKVSVGTISNYERGIHQPNLDTLCCLADYYNTTTDYLLGRTSHPFIYESDSQKKDALLELREKLFLDTAGLSENSLCALEWLTCILRHYERLSNPSKIPSAPRLKPEADKKP